MDNLSNKEIAEQMNISVKAVEGHISRALKQIRAYLGMPITTYGDFISTRLKKK